MGAVCRETGATEAPGRARPGAGNLPLDDGGVPGVVFCPTTGHGNDGFGEAAG